MKRSFRIFAIFAVIVLLAAVLQRAIARPADKPRISFSKSEYSYISPATASALTTLAQMRAVANQQRDSGLDVDALINAANAAGDTTDTDGDGLNDKDEKDCGSSLLLPDPDDDTLFDNLECELGTDPWNPDTDDDGANDGYEVNVLNTSPLLNDTDFDLLLDGDELTWKTDRCIMIRIGMDSGTGESWIPALIHFTRIPIMTASMTLKTLIPMQRT